LLTFWSHVALIRPVARRGTRRIWWPTIIAVRSLLRRLGRVREFTMKRVDLPSVQEAVVIAIE
jgi:hypothetical protein